MTVNMRRATEVPLVQSDNVAFNDRVKATTWSDFTMHEDAFTETPSKIDAATQVCKLGMKSLPNTTIELPG